MHTYTRDALKDSAAVGVAGTIVQAMTGVRATVVYSKSQEAMWGLTKDKPIGVKAKMEGPAMYRFLASCVEFVMPKIKEYKGIKRSSGDDSGNISFGFSPEAVALFPEVEGMKNMKNPSQEVTP